MQQRGVESACVWCGRYNTGYTHLLTTSRSQARESMRHEARTRGANAIVAMRSDCNEIGGVMSEIAAYGTAVTVEPAAGCASGRSAPAGGDARPVPPRPAG
jgi:uncharacterized protein YbjQ (UPF0145 family)